MIQVNPDQVTPDLKSFFDPHAPASLRCFSVLAGQDGGKILADSLTQSTWGAVWEPGDGCLYLGGKLDAATVQDIIAILRRDGDVVVQF